ncbi:hypothetical protein MCEMSE6_02804 [Oxalobacteraceae bacterium]
MDKLNKRERKEQRKEAIKAYQPTPEQIEKFKEDFGRLVYKNEYQDILSTEECFDSLIDEMNGKKK